MKRLINHTIKKIVRIAQLELINLRFIFYYQEHPINGNFKSIQRNRV